MRLLDILIPALMATGVVYFGDALMNPLRGIVRELCLGGLAIGSLSIFVWFYFRFELMYV